MKNPKKILLPLAGALCLSATLSSALAAAFPVTLHNLTPSQREALRGQGQVGTAYLSQNNETGTNLCSLYRPGCQRRLCPGCRSRCRKLQCTAVPGQPWPGQSSIKLHRLPGGRRGVLYRSGARKNLLYEDQFFYPPIFWLYRYL